MDDELLDLVNGYDTVIGTINRKEYSRLISEKMGFIRAAELFILNDKGQLWVPTRTAHKTIAPNGYDYAAAGHVASGSNYLNTIIRETEEEINITLKMEEIEYVANIKSVNTCYFRNIYLLRSNNTPVINPDDFSSAAWIDPTKLITLIENGHPAKSSLVSSIQVLENYLTGN